MHPDKRVAMALQRINATLDAEAAASQLFGTWDDLARFFSRVFEGRETGIEGDLARDHLAESYEAEDFGLKCPVRPGSLLHHLGKNGISAVKDAAYVAEFSRAFLADPALFDGHGDADYTIAFEAVRDFGPEQLAVFGDFDIHKYTHREHVRKCVISYRVPVDYVRGLWMGPAGEYAQVNASTVYELHNIEVPIGYARTAVQAYAYFSMLRQTTGERVSELLPSALSLGEGFRALAAEFGDADISEPGWHTLALHRAHIPASYVETMALRSAADIIALYEAGVPGSYAKAFRFSTAVPIIIDGYRCGIPQDYMTEVTS